MNKKGLRIGDWVKSWDKTSPFILLEKGPSENFNIIRANLHKSRFDILATKSDISIYPIVASVNFADKIEPAYLSFDDISVGDKVKSIAPNLFDFAKEFTVISKADGQIQCKSKDGSITRSRPQDLIVVKINSQQEMEHPKGELFKKLLNEEIAHSTGAIKVELQKHKHLWESISPEKAARDKIRHICDYYDAVQKTTKLQGETIGRLYKNIAAANSRLSLLKFDNDKLIAENCKLREKVRASEKKAALPADLMTTANELISSEYKKDAAIVQSNLRKRIEANKAYVSAIERGINMPRIDFYYKILAGLALILLAIGVLV